MKKILITMGDSDYKHFNKMATQYGYTMSDFTREAIKEFVNSKRKKSSETKCEQQKD